MIIIDTNEYAHNPKLWQPIIHKQDNLEFDFIIQGEAANFCVERKTFQDLKASLNGDERLWRQCRALQQAKEQGYTVFLACIGNEWLNIEKLHVMTKAQYIGIQIAVARMGVNYIHLNREEDFVLLLQHLDERAGKPRVYQRPTIRKPTRTLSEERSDMYSAVEGIGRRRSSLLVEQYGAPLQLITAIQHRDEDSNLQKLLGKKAYQHLKLVLGVEAEGDEAEQ